MDNFNLKNLITENFGENYNLHEKYVNKTLVKVLRTIGFDKCYKSAKGAYLYDAEGNEYLDFLSGYGVYGIGRNHPVVAQAIKDALDLDLPNMVQMDCALLSGLLAKELARIAGGNREAVFLCNSGTEAIEGAMKFARAHTKRSRMLSLKGAYHGLSYGSLSLTANKNFQSGFGSMVPDVESVKFNDLDDLESKLKSKDVAGFIFEPVQGKGVFYAPDEYYKNAQELCRKYGTLFIADEVQTGLGRTGKMFGFEHWGLDPDIVTVAKTLSGGYIPVGAFITSRPIHQSTFCSLDRCVVHSSTFGRNNLAMVAGLATLSVLEKENLVQRSADMGAELLRRVSGLKEKHQFIKDVRGKGLMLAVDFQEPKSLGLKMAWKALKMADDALFTQMIVSSLMDNHRILSHVASHGMDTIKILPPYVIGEKEIEKFVNALDDVLSNAGNVTGPLWTFGKRLVSASMANKKGV